MFGHRDAGALISFFIFVIKFINQFFSFSGLFGYSHMAGGFPGGQAEYVRVRCVQPVLLLFKGS